MLYEVITVLKVESKYTIRMHSRVGKAIPLYCTAIGKMLLSDLEEGTRKAVISRIKQVPFTPNTLKTPAALERELSEIKGNGWSMDP